MDSSLKDSIRSSVDAKGSLRDSNIKVYALLKSSFPFELNAVYKISEGVKTVQEFIPLHHFHDYHLLQWQIPLISILDYKKFKVKYVNLKTKKSKTYTQKIVNSEGKIIKTQEIFLFETQLQDKNNTMEPHNTLEAILVYTYLLSLTGCGKQTFYILFDQMPKLSNLSLTESLEKINPEFLESQLGQYFRLSYEISLVLNGKLIACRDVALKTKTELKKLDMILPELLLDDEKKTLNLIFEKEEIEFEGILNGIYNKVIVDLKTSNDTRLYHLLLKTLEIETLELHIDRLEQLPNFGEKIGLKTEIASIILTKDIATEQKLYYLLKIYSEENKSIVESLMIANEDMLKSSPSNALNNQDFQIQNDSFFRKVITFVNKKLDKATFWGLLKDHNIDSYLFMSSPSTHPAIKKIIRASELKAALNEYIGNILDSRKVEDIQFMVFIFMVYPDRSLVTYTLDQYLSEFTKPNSYWISVPPPSSMDYFLERLLFPLILQAKDQQTEVLRSYSNYLERWSKLRFFPPEKTLEGFDNIIANSKEGSRDLAKFICNGLFKDENLENLTKKHFKDALNCKSFLKESFMEILLSKLKDASEKQKGEVVPILTESLIRDINNKDDWKSEIRVKIIIFGGGISQSEIKYAIYTEPDCCKAYSSLLRNPGNQPSKAIQSLKTMVKKEVDPIINGKISYTNCKKIEAFKEKNKLDMIIELMQHGQNHNIKQIFENMFEKCRSFDFKVEQIELFIENHRAIKIMEITKKSLKYHVSTIIPLANITELRLPEDIEKLSKAALEYNKILDSWFFQHFYGFEKKDTLDDIITSCNTAYEKMCLFLKSVAERLKDATLTMDIIEEYFYKIRDKFDQEMSKILDSKILDFTKLGKEEIEKLRKAINYYDEKPRLISLSNFLIDLYQILMFDQQLLNKAQSYSKLTEYDIKVILVRDFVQKTYELKKTLNENKLSDLMNKNPVNELLHSLAKARGLLKFLGIINRADFIEMKDFINDLSDTDLKRQLIEDFEQLWGFKNDVIDKCKNLMVFLETLRELKVQYENLNSLIQRCNESQNDVKKALSDMKYRDVSFRFRIKEIMSGSVLRITGNDSYKLVNITINDNLYQMFDKQELVELKEKARLFILYQNRKGNSEKELYFLKSFIDLVDLIEVIIKSYQELDNLGFIQNFIDPYQDKLELRIPEEVGQIEKYRDCVRNYNESWKVYLNKLYSASYLFSHFYGKQLKDLYETIFIKKGVDNSIKHLLSYAQISFETFQERIATSKVDDYFRKTAFEKMLFISELLDQAANTQSLKMFDPVSPKHRVTLVSVPEEKIILASATLVAGEKQMQEIKLSQFLFCHPNTNLTEIICFLNRAFLNNQSLCHFIIGFENLNAQLQNLFCDSLDSSLNISRGRSLNLILIGSSSSTKEKIYQYFYHHKDFIKELIQNIDEKESAVCASNLLRKVERFEIVYSKSAGLGKTHYILKKCKELNLNPYFFPIAGNINPERIGQRLRSIDFGKYDALIIQVHNVVDKRILGEILFQLIFFRSLKADNFLFTTSQFYLFIEIQNISNENYLASVRTLKLFQNSRFITFIEEAKAVNIAIINPEIEPKFYFVMLYLKALKEGQLEEQDISYFSFEQEFLANRHRIEEDLCKSLADEYFFIPLEHHTPSFTQFNCFIELLFSALKTFGESPYFKKHHLEYVYEKINESLRRDAIKIVKSDFVRMLVLNSSDFVIRTVSQDHLKGFPLLIMSLGENMNSSSYSLIYNDIKKVPKELKIFFLFQMMKSPEANDLVQWRENENKLNKNFIDHDLSLNDSKSLLEKLRIISGVAKIEEDPNYAITKDNFYKMCLIIQRMRSQIPIVIMGETGVGKTALIRFLVQNVYHDDLEVINIHAGVNEKELIQRMEALQKRAVSLSSEKRLWVFFDEFNTSEEVGLISEVLLNRRFLGEPIKGNLVFLGACNPFRKREEKKDIVKAGIPKTQRVHEDASLYKVLPPPESLIEVMWDYQDLKEAETLEYLAAILKIDYKIDKVIDVINFTHKYLQENIEKSAVSLRDVTRFVIVYNWFKEKMPNQSSSRSFNLLMSQSLNRDLPQDERAFILALCFCYYLRIPLQSLREEYIQKVESKMEYDEGHILQVFMNEQNELLKKMNITQGIALNLALRENIFAAFVCLLNKIPIIFVGIPGSSKSLSIRLLRKSLKGQRSSQEFFRHFEELSVVHFQGSESCTSESVESVFKRAERNLRIENVIPTILFDEIGLAELSVHNPLKVIHSRLEVGRTEVSFIGISNWELDVSKMGRFLIISRPLPEEEELKETAIKIFESITDYQVLEYKSIMDAVSATYHGFIQKWKHERNEISEFFGLRDFYSLVKFISNKIKVHGLRLENRQDIMNFLRKGIERSFDGQKDSINMFLEEAERHFADATNFLVREGELHSMSFIEKILEDSESRSLLAITKGEVLIDIISIKLKLGGKEILRFYGSPFEQDKFSEEYHVQAISQFINYVQEGFVVFCKNVNNAVLTSLYDLFNKSYLEIENKEGRYCQVAVGAHFKARCLVNPKFNSIVYLDESKLKEADPPFLNRFEKHYLTPEKFLDQVELVILNKISEWLEKMTPRYPQAEAALQKENFFANCSLEALTSLCVKHKLKVEAENIDREDLINESAKLCKKDLLRNTTPDFIFWVDSSNLITSDIKEYEFVKGEYQAKNKINLENFSKELGLRLIIFTYDQMNNNPDVSNNTKIIKMSEMKCENDLTTEVKNYIESNQKLCLIKMNYETEITYLPLLTLIIDDTQKFWETSWQKKFVILLHYSRIAAAKSDQVSLASISYLNGWTQIFLESLSNNNDTIKIERLPHTLIEVIDHLGIDLEREMNQSLKNSIKRFDFKLSPGLKNKQLIFSSLQTLPEILNNPLFKQLCKDYLDKLAQDFLNIDWRTEVLNNKGVALQALDVDKAIRLCITEKIEDLLVIILKRLFDEDVFMSLFCSFTLEIMEEIIPDIKQYILAKLPGSNLSYNPELFKSIFDISLPYIIASSLLQKEISINISISYPRLFPFSKRNEEALFIREEGESSSTNLYSIALQLKELDYLSELEDIDNRQFEYEALKDSFNQLFKQKSQLIKFDNEGNSIKDILTQLNGQHYLVEREFYLTDIRNAYLERIVKVDLKNSNFLDKLLMLFTSNEYSIEDYLWVLFRGCSLWKPLIHIYDKIRANLPETSNAPQEIFFPRDFENVRIKKVGDFLKAQKRYIISFLTSLEQVLVPQEINLTKFCQTRNILKSIYFWILNLEIEFKVRIPSLLVCWNDLIDLAEIIYLDKLKPYQDHLDRIFMNANSLSRVDFPRQLKKIVTSVLIGQMDSHQDLPESFGRFLSEIIGCKGLSKVDEIVQDLERLDENQRELNNYVQQKGYGNRLSTLITDYFNEIIIDTEIDQINENESNASKLLTQSFESFSCYMKKIEEREGLNCLQKLAIFAFFRHYLKNYVKCYNEGKKYEVLKSIDKILINDTSLIKNMRIFILKLLLKKQVSFDKLNEYLLNTETPDWVFKLEDQPIRYKEIPENKILTPVVAKPEGNSGIEQKWNELKRSAFSKKEAFRELLDVARASDVAKYQFLNLLLVHAYTASMSQKCLKNLKILQEENSQELRDIFNRYQIKLINCYMNGKINEHYLDIHNNREFAKHILILNTVNWLVCLNKINSAWTSLFFTNGEIVDSFSIMFKQQFVITGQDNPYVLNASKVLENYKYNGIYICSTKCDYIYAIPGSGWPKETLKCHFCGSDIGLARGGFHHVLAGSNKGARRLGRNLDKYESNTYCDNVEFQNNKLYWDDIQKSIMVEIDRIKEKDEITILKEGKAVKKCLIGYDRHKQQESNSIERIDEVTDYFLQLVLHSSLYAVTALGWIPLAEISELVGPYAPLDYFKKKIEDNINSLLEHLDWDEIVNLQQSLWKIVEKTQIKDSKITCKARDEFEFEVHQLIKSISSNKSNSQNENLKKSQHFLTRFERILREKEIDKDYEFLQILRLSKRPSLKNMKKFYKNTIENQYPVLNELLDNLPDIQNISKMISIIKFSNEMARIINDKMTLEEANSTRISDFIDRQDEDLKKILKESLNKFLNDWNSLRTSLKLIEYESQTIGIMREYDQNTPIVAFLVDSLDIRNEYGRILAGVIYTLSKKQNTFLKRIASLSKFVEYFDKKLYLPQTSSAEDIINITESLIIDIVAKASTVNCNYGNGISIYDFERIQFNLILKLIGKKLFSLDFKLYKNVRFSTNNTK